MPRPIDNDLRVRIAVLHAEQPRLTNAEIARKLTCAPRTVAEVIAPRAKERGTRVVIPAELVAKAEERGGVLAVLEAALAVAPPSPEPPLGVRDRWLPGQRG